MIQQSLEGESDLGKQERFWIGFGLCTVFILVSLLHYGVSSIRDEVTKAQLKAEGAAPEEDTFNEYGLPKGQTLSEKVLYESEKYRVYSDRVLKRYLAVRNAGENIAAQVNGIRSGLSKAGFSDIPVTIVAVPVRITCENDSQTDITAYKAHMKQVKNAVSGTAFVCDPQNSISSLIGEKYVFYRTDESWTLIGAYYGYKELCKELGIGAKDLDAAPVMNQNDFYGNEYMMFSQQEATRQVKNKMTGMTEDIFVWLHSDTFLDREIQYDFTEGTEIRRPVILYSVMGSSSVVGGSFDYALCDGNGSDGIILIADSAGTMLAPYLCENFGRVCVVNITGYGGFYKDLGRLVRENNIKHIVIAQLADRIGDRAYSKAINVK